MPLVTIVTGVLLSVLGLMGYLFSDSRSLTALIPLAFGSLLEFCGVLALLGVLGSARGLPGFFAILSGDQIARPLGALVQGAMFAICLIFLVLCIRSFRAARKARQAAATA